VPALRVICATAIICFRFSTSTAELETAIWGGVPDQEQEVIPEQRELVERFSRSPFLDRFVLHDKPSGIVAVIALLIVEFPGLTERAPERYTRF
jgi:hypothetical protein